MESEASSAETAYDRCWSHPISQDAYDHVHASGHAVETTNTWLVRAEARSQDCKETTSTQPPSAPHNQKPRSTHLNEHSPPSRRAARRTCQPALRDQDLCRPTHERTYVCFSGASRTSLISLFIETLSYPSLLVQEAGKDSKYPFLG